MSLVPSTVDQPKITGVPGEHRIDAAPEPVAQQLNNAHPLETRIANWRANEDASFLKMLQRTQGAAEPIRRTMETQIVESSAFVPAVIGGPSNLHLDILRNNDARVDWDDVYNDAPAVDFHQELQRVMKF